MPMVLETSFLGQILVQGGIIAQKLKQNDELQAQEGAVLSTGTAPMAELDAELERCERWIALRPEDAQAHKDRGNALQGLGRPEEAIASYERAIALDADYADAHYNRGNVLNQLGRHELALASFERAIELNAQDAQAYNNRGIALQGLGRHERAIENFHKAIELSPGYAQAYNNLGLALQKQGRHEQALECYERALAIMPDSPEVLTHRGSLYLELGHFPEALASYQKAVALRPEYADAHLNEGLCRLLIGDFECGWRKYEWRLKLDRPGFEYQHFRQPLWLGKEPLEGRTIFLHAEQGLGDSIQFCRYVPEVARKGAKVILGVQPTLKRLMSHLQGADQVLSDEEALPEFDCQCPLLSLPLAFDTRLETIPAAIPYLRADPGTANKWERRLGSKSAARIGIVWSGNPEHKNDHNRSVGLSRMLKLASAQVSLVSLQRDVRPEDGELLAQNRQIIHFGRELTDFYETAALVSLMDLVISVDTSVAHLAGALGKKVWILLPFAPDWRWLADQEDSPWYPSARLFRQPRHGDWDTVIEKVKSELQSLTLNGRTQGARG